jgi:hypothetical protein
MSRAEYQRAYREKLKKTPRYVALREDRIIQQREYRERRKEVIQELVYVAERALHYAKEYEIPRLEMIAEAALLTVGDRYVK